jgi:hypothetical protein
MTIVARAKCRLALAAPRDPFARRFFGPERAFEESGETKWRLSA